MPSLDSLATLSGLMVFFGTFALLYSRLTAAAALFMIDGAAGVGVFWERWSRETPHHMKVMAIFDGVTPSNAEWALLSTHLPVLLLGLIILTAASRRKMEANAFNGNE